MTKNTFESTELVLPQSRTPAVEKNEILDGYRTSAPAVEVIELVLPHSRTPAVEKKRNITWVYN